MLNEDMLDIISQVIECTCKGPVAYMSTPVSSRLPHHSSDLTAKEVIDDNTRRAAIAASILDGAFGLRVLNPALLYVDGWGGDDYMVLWEHILKHNVKYVYFNDNWQYSDGCKKEYFIAFDLGLPTYDINNEILTHKKALALIEEASTDE